MHYAIFSIKFERIKHFFSQIIIGRYTVDIIMCSLFLSAGYPAAANPTLAPEITQIGNETRYTISVANSTPTGVDDTLGYSTIIVRVLDLSSATQNDSTYYVLVSK